MEGILITGGAGYIGGYAAQRLIEAGERVLILDNLSMGTREAVPPGAEFIEGDIGDSRLVRDILADGTIKTVMHFAAFIDVAESERDPEKYDANNFQKARSLMEAAAASGVERFIFSSTAAVYGNPDSLPVGEGHPTRPINAYGRSKLKAEEALKALCEHSPMRYVILRYFNVAGAHPDGERGYVLKSHPPHLIRKAIAVALGREKALEIYGTNYPTRDGTCIRDYIHIADLVEAHLAALTHLENGGESETYNVGYGRGYSVLEVVKAVRRVGKQPVKVSVAQKRPGDCAEMIADPSRIQKELNWFPRYKELDTMISHQLRWEASQF